MAKAATKKLAPKKDAKKSKAVVKLKTDKAKVKAEAATPEAKRSLASFYAETIDAIDKELRLTIGEGTSASAITSDFSALSTALSSGDSSTSQTAFQTLMSDLASQSSASSTGQSPDAWLLSAYSTTASLTAS